MEYPSVSVIVLSFNSLQHMEDCFTSLGQLDYPADRVELVLADNASGDGTVAYVRAHFPGVRILEFEENYGFCGGNNRAAALSQSEFVAFLNPDMRVEPHWLSGLVEALGDESEVVCSASKVLAWDGKALDFAGLLISFLGFGRADGYQEPDLTAYDGLRYILGPIGGAMLINRQVFLDVGGFDEDFFAYFDDIDLGWRLWILGYKVVFAPQSICYHIHYGSWSKQPQVKVHYLYERNALYTIIKNYEEQYLERVLPVALLLQAKRAYLYGEMSGIEMDKCRFKADTQDEADLADRPDLEDRRSPEDGAATPPIRYDTRYYLREAWRTLRVDGVTALVRKAIDELDRRRGHPMSQILPPELATRQQPSFWIQQAHLAATNDVIENYASLLEKRESIQENRRRTDEEIFQSVRALSFDVCFDTPGYRQTQQRLAELFGIPELFDKIYDPEIPFALRPKEQR
jgi:GT2 family glycosyltransferase